AFRVDPSVPRAAMTGALPPGARLTRFDGTFGIARAAHDQRDAVVAALNGLASVGGREVRVRTLAVSGTLKAAASRLPPRAGAAQRGPRPRRDESKA
ncbi:MAG TPA: Rpp14/Pop5 family protein, partial [Candidatus Thermoplasmatota archaeon]|nr:Rpp14/Pop5 family protein [Candidatus Thermoplasmatota archaeon]